MPTYYADPLTGRPTNIGSAEAPWGSMASVLANNKSVLRAGDTVLLRRGYHGILNLTGVYEADLFLHAAPGHSPTVRAITFMNARHWNIKGLTISTSTTPAGHPDASIAVAGVTIDTQTNENSHFNTLEGCALYTVQDSTKFTARDWANKKAGITVCGSNNVIKGNHLYNGGGIQVMYHANNTYVGYNTIENVGSDCMGLKGNKCIVEYNLFMNTHKVDGNHNDLLQAWGSTGNIVRFNEFRAYTDPKQPFISDGKSSAVGVSITQGIGCFDGTFKDWVIEGNIIRVDHTIGIWMLGPQNCVIKDNVIFRCGAKVWNNNGKPGIKVSTTKGGSPAKNNTVTGNRAMALILGDATNAGAPIGVQSGNSVITSYTPPADTSVPTVPTALAAVRIPGYGVDLQWTASADNKAVDGYDVFRNGTKIGRTRAGTRFLVTAVAGAGSYTVQAFDRKGNKSVVSSAAVIA